VVYKIAICDIYYWENLKRKVYRNTPRLAEALQNELRNVVASILADKLQHVSQDSFEDVRHI
jgi:hypothetical protein